MNKQPYRKIICARANCENESSVYPVLHLYATKLLIRNIPNDPIEVEFRELPTCLECMAKVHENDILNDEGWLRLSEAIMKNGKAKPNRDLTELIWKTVLTGEKFDKTSMQ